MNNSPSRYGGIAAVMVFGIGLLALGRTWAGVAVLGFGVLVMTIALAPSLAARLAFLAIGALICSGVLAFKAASNEITGKATYCDIFTRHSHAEPVTRQDSPTKFRRATNVLWVGAILCVLGGVWAFSVARRLDD